MQAAVVASMTSALFLESTVTELYHLPLLSIMRAVRLSPLSLLQSQILRWKRPPQVAYSVIVFLSAILAVAGQFISTILLSDFVTVRIATPENVTDARLIDRRVFLLDKQPSFLGTAPSAYWRFAEYHEDPGHQDDPETATYTDTGVTLRAAIPWADASSRLNLLRYSGSALLWDARVYCFRPTLSNVTFKTAPIQVDVKRFERHAAISTIPVGIPYYNKPTEDPENPPEAPHSYIPEEKLLPVATAIAGNIIHSTEHPFLNKTYQETTTDPDFNCSIPRSPGAAICSLRLSYELETPLNISSYSEELTYGFMIFKFNIPDHGPIPDLSDVVIDENLTTNGWSLLGHGPWTTVVHRSDYELLSCSACFTIPALFHSNLTMSGTTGKSEPEMGWSGDTGDESQNGSPDTSDIRHQLGVTPDQTTLDGRGIIALDPSRVVSEQSDGPEFAGLINLDQSSITLVLVNHTRYGPNGLGVQCSDENNYIMANSAHTALLDDILNTTNNPAYAIQALSTTFYQMQYFDSSYRWARGPPATYAFSKDLSIPKNRTGLIIVVSIVAVHMFLVGTTVTTFLVRTRASLLGNVWQSVAQVVSDRTTDILWTADSMTDTEIKKALSGTTYEQDIKSVGVIRRRRNGRNEFGSVDE